MIRNQTADAAWLWHCLDSSARDHFACHSSHSQSALLGRHALCKTESKILFRPGEPMSLPPFAQYTSVDSSSSHASSTGPYMSSQHAALHLTHNSSHSSSGISHLANMPNMGNSLSGTGGGIVGASVLHSAAIAASSALGHGSNGAAATSNLSAPRTTTLLSSATGEHVNSRHREGSAQIFLLAACL